MQRHAREDDSDGAARAQCRDLRGPRCLKMVHGEGAELERKLESADGVELIDVRLDPQHRGTCCQEDCLCLDQGERLALDEHINRARETSSRGFGNQLVGHHPEVVRSLGLDARGNVNQERGLDPGRSAPCKRCNHFE